MHGIPVLIFERAVVIFFDGRFELSSKYSSKLIADAPLLTKKFLLLQGIVAGLYQKRSKGAMSTHVPGRQGGAPKSGLR